jgi:6-pyruvoyltetrahydropterin/6-carboxytetrahydropterin synthase
MNDRMYSTGTGAQVRASHVMPGMPPPEGEPHEHDYRLDVVASRGALDGRGMVVDLDVLGEALQQVVDSVDGADLDAVVGAQLGVEAVTVESFSRWVHDRLAAALGPLPGTSLAVRVWESPTAFGGYAGPLDEEGSGSS